MIPQGTISEILRQKGSSALAIGPDATVFEAIQVMADKNVGALLVTDKDKLVGIITERDYTRNVALKANPPGTSRFAKSWTEKVLYVTPAHNVDECMHLMTNHRVRHLPVLEGGKIAGIVSIGDLVNWIINAKTRPSASWKPTSPAVRAKPRGGTHPCVPVMAASLPPGLDEADIEANAAGMPRSLAGWEACRYCGRSWQPPHFRQCALGP